MEGRFTLHVGGGEQNTSVATLLLLSLGMTALSTSSSSGCSLHCLNYSASPSGVPRLVFSYQLKVRTSVGIIISISAVCTPLSSVCKSAGQGKCSSLVCNQGNNLGEAQSLDIKLPKVQAGGKWAPSKVLLSTFASAEVFILMIPDTLAVSFCPHDIAKSEIVGYNFKHKHFLVMSTLWPNCRTVHRYCPYDTKCRCSGGAC